MKQYAQPPHIVHVASSHIFHTIHLSHSNTLDNDIKVVSAQGKKSWFQPTQTMM
jgi:hypothetical protein